MTVEESLEVISAAERARRVVRDLRDEIEEAGYEVTGVVGLFSGGNDSTTMCHILRDELTHVAHCNTGIGIELTRQFVRDRAADWGLPLIEVHPPSGSTYREMVLDQGFPGPAHHYKMYQRLKERGLRQVRKQLVSNGRRQRVIFVAGRRRAESNRRASVPERDREGAIEWVSPLVDWTNEMMKAYREHFDVPRNEVSDMIHMSGECLCGAFATKGELDEIEFFFPEVAAEIRQLELEVAQEFLRRGEPLTRCRWGWGAYRDDPDMPPDLVEAWKRGEPFKVGPLCSSCEGRRDDQHV